MSHIAIERIPEFHHASITELGISSGVNQAVHQGHRADFALLLAFLSQDIRDNLPINAPEVTDTNEAVLRERFSLATPQALTQSQQDYANSAYQAQLFHQAGLASAKLAHYLKPEALLFLPENTQGLPEEVFLNLSGHERRQLAEHQQPKNPHSIFNIDKLYVPLHTAWRHDQLNLHA